MRFKTREVKVGNVGLGADNPIRIQSMTTSNTRDVQATVEQIIRLADEGCEIVRITVQGMKEADACEQIKNQLTQKGLSIPLVADIHFFPPAAMRVVDFVDKVRINPGNYVDRRAQFKRIEYSDASYRLELERIEERFTPLIVKCKALKRAMRIGTNHGSLSDRIMNRYGDTAAGMVESALEFARICRQQDYHDIIFSMKASNPIVMIEAYRRLVAVMQKLGWDYPLHLGVTEAGEGEDGRVKSAVGIGTLLLEGIGDTIRVSLTEDPWQEIDPCKRLRELAKRSTAARYPIGSRQVDLSHPAIHRDGTVWLPCTREDLQSDELREIGLSKVRVDAVVAESTLSLKEQVKVICPLTLEGLIRREREMRFRLTPSQPTVLIVRDEPEPLWSVIKRHPPSVILLSPTENRLSNSRRFVSWLQREELQAAVLLHYHYECEKEDFIIQAAAECGAMLCDRLAEGLCLSGPYSKKFLKEFSFTLLQAARMRTTRTDFISCPSCGRTLFNLQEVTARIRSRTNHLPGVKIAIMGCIVNGPGEMADAHFGYVGSKQGKIDLYIGKECVEKNIDSKEADDRLIDLIKAQGRWIEPGE